MKLYAPTYYPEFSCIADRCRHSCCIGWEIDVDDDTLARYNALGTDCTYGETIRQSIDTDGVPHFRLGDGERCPHLDERGLCRIIRSLGEGYLCDICREHPRFYNVTSHGLEVGLGLACEEAARLILFSEHDTAIVEVDTLAGELEAPSFDVLPLRTELYALLSDASIPYADRLRRIGERYDVSLHAHTDDEWRNVLGSLEYLNETHAALFGCYSSGSDTPTVWERPLMRALTYFIFRHVTAAGSMQELRAALGLCLFCERLLASLVKHNTPSTLDDFTELARILSEEIEYSEDNTEAIKAAFY